MRELRARALVAALLGAGLLACARETPRVSAPGPVAVIAWLQGLGSIAGVDGTVRPAAIEAELFLTDRLLLEQQAVVILGLYNNRVVKLDQSLRVRDIAALQLPPDDRPLEVQLSELLDRTTLSARDELQAQNARIAGWHVRRNAASTVTAQTSAARVVDESEGVKAQVATEPTQLEHEPASATPAEPVSASNAEVKPGRGKGEVTVPAPQPSAVVAATTNEANGQTLQIPDTKRQAPTTGAKDLQAVGKDPVVAASGEAVGGDSGGDKTAPVPGRSEPEVDAETQNKKPALRQPSVKAKVRAVPGAELIAVEGELSQPVQLTILRGLTGAGIRACLRSASGEGAAAVEVELRLKQGAVTSLTLLRTGTAVSCDSLPRELAKLRAKIAAHDPTTAPPTGILRARVDLR